jgi:hypothetical protein
MASGVSSSDFPNVFGIVRARNSLAANRRAEELQPGAVQKQRQEVELNAFTLGREERGVASEKETARILDDIRADRPGAFRELALHDPARLTSVLEAQAKKRDMDLNAFNTRLMAVGRFATGFAGSQGPGGTPEQAQQQYTQGREALVRRFPELSEEDVPVKPNSLFLKRAISALSAVSELQKQAGFGQGNAFVQVGGPEPGSTQTRRVEKAGPTEDIGPPKLPAPPKTGGAGGSGKGIGEITSADTNTLKSIINDRVGEFFDPRTNEIKVLDPERAALALGILEEASRIFARGGVTHADAVTQAARKFDVQIQEAAGAGDNRARPGAEGETRTKQLKAFRDFVNKQ